MSVVDMKESADQASRDMVMGSKPTGHNNHDEPFRRTMSETNFEHLRQMEKHYSKLGDSATNTKGHQINGKIRVASLSSLNSDYKSESVGENGFAGRRDVTNPESIKEKQILSRRGSIRGCKNRVRAGIATFSEQQNGYKVS